AASREQADDAGENAGFVVDQHRHGMSLDRIVLAQACHFRPLNARYHAQTASLQIRHDYTSTMPSSETGFATSSGPSSISLCAEPDGIIGKQFSFSSTRQSTITGPGCSIMRLMTDRK